MHIRTRTASRVQLRRRSEWRSAWRQDDKSGRWGLWTLIGRAVSCCNVCTEVQYIDTHILYGAKPEPGKDQGEERRRLRCARPLIQPPSPGGMESDDRQQANHGGRSAKQVKTHECLMPSVRTSGHQDTRTSEHAVSPTGFPTSPSSSPLGP